MLSIHARSSDTAPVVIHLQTEGCSAAGLIEFLSSTGMPIGTVDGYEAIRRCDYDLRSVAVVVVGDQLLDAPGMIALVSDHLADGGLDRLVLVMTARPLSFHQRLALSPLGNVRLFSVHDELRLVRDAIREWKRNRSTAGYRVLLVEDSRTDAYLATKYMERVGIEVMHIRSADLVLDAMHEFEPDVIVSDLHMADCNGAEMARVIRQDREATLPILFLSSEADCTKQMEALSSGADGFIRKPLLQEPFIQVLKSTIQRSVAVENRMRRDPLTNLLNRGQFMSNMRRMAGRGEQCSVAILDIDHFKKVNDTYGHPIGDLVICGLAQMLQDSLRSTDFIGRIGGEEFALLMPGCSSEDAARIIHRLREMFQSMNFSADQDVQFSCTISAGISSLGRDCLTAYRSADDALYVSKKMGRNRVTVSPKG